MPVYSWYCSKNSRTSRGSGPSVRRGGATVATGASLARLATQGQLAVAVSMSFSVRCIVKFRQAATGLPPPVTRLNLTGLERAGSSAGRRDALREVQRALVDG